jgi:hypothetical protein
MNTLLCSSIPSATQGHVFSPPEDAATWLCKQRPDLTSDALTLDSQPPSWEKCLSVSINCPVCVGLLAAQMDLRHLDNLSLPAHERGKCFHLCMSLASSSHVLWFSSYKPFTFLAELGPEQLLPFAVTVSGIISVPSFATACCLYQKCSDFCVHVSHCFAEFPYCSTGSLWNFRVFYKQDPIVCAQITELSICCLGFFPRLVLSRTPTSA